MSVQTKIFIRRLGLGPTNTTTFIKNIKKSIFSTLLLLFLSTSAYANWHPLSPGIEFQDLQSTLLNPWSHIYAFRIDVTNNQLNLVTAKNMGQKNASADQFAEYSKALIAINGGFFDQAFKPLGLRIQQGRTINPIKRISWWGIFYMQEGKPHITNLRGFSGKENVEFAVQSGPRLIINGRIPSLKPGVADRTALGITQDNQVIIVVSNNAAMTTKELALLMKNPPLSCYNAINLDGGSSSQLYVNIHSFKLNVHGFSNVSDAVIVQTR